MKNSPFSGRNFCYESCIASGIADPCRSAFRPTKYSVRGLFAKNQVCAISAAKSKNRMHKTVSKQLSRRACRQTCFERVFRPKINEKHPKIDPNRVRVALQTGSDESWSDRGRSNGQVEPKKRAREAPGTHQGRPGGLCRG